MESTRINVQGLKVPRGNAGAITARIARPGVPGFKEAVFASGELPTIQQALDQVGISIRADKEGVIVKGSTVDKDGTIKNLNDGIVNGATYFIMPGISSQ